MSPTSMLDRYRRKENAAKSVASQLCAEYGHGAGRRRGTPDAETRREYVRRRLDSFPDVDHADVLYFERMC